MEKKEYKAPYFHARYMTAIEPLMVSRISDTDTGFEGGLVDDDDMDLDGE